MPFDRQTARGARFIPYEQGGQFPTKDFENLVLEALRESRQSRVAVMADEESKRILPSFFHTRP